MKKHIRLAIAGLCLLAIIVPSSHIYASHGDSTENETNTSGSSGSGSGGSGSGSPTTRTEQQAPSGSDRTEPRRPDRSSQPKKVETPKKTSEAEHGTEAQEAEHTSRSRRDEILADARKNGKEHSKEERLKNCQNRQADVQKRVTNAQSQAQKHLDKINSVLAKIQTSDFDKTKIANYDQLLSAATQAQSDATAAVSALKNLNPSVDCTSDTPANNVADFKAGFEQARASLKTYRTSVKAILIQIEATQPTPATETEQKS